jgi:hypothetical protein
MGKKIWKIRLKVFIFAAALGDKGFPERGF